MPLLFAYGTLMSGERYFRNIPRPPLWIHRAHTRGRLLLVHKRYPGLVEGESLVHGQLMAFHGEDESAVLPVLDSIEGYQGPGGQNLYERRTAPVFDEEPGQEVDAWLYVYSGPEGPWPAIPGGRWPPPLTPDT